MHDFALFTKILCKIPKVPMLTLHQIHSYSSSKIIFMVRHLTPIKYSTDNGGP